MDAAWKLITVLITVTALWISYQQWWVNREKFRLELQSKRYAVFEAARRFIVSIVREARVDHEWQTDFWQGTADAGFLFRPDIKDYLDKLNANAANLHVHVISQKDVKAEQRQHHVERETELMLWFASQLRDDGLAEVFAPYLRFEDMPSPLAAIWPPRRWAIGVFGAVALIVAGVTAADWQNWVPWPDRIAKVCDPFGPYCIVGEAPYCLVETEIAPGSGRVTADCRWLSESQCEAANFLMLRGSFPVSHACVRNPLLDE